MAVRVRQDKEKVSNAAFVQLYLDKDDGCVRVVLGLWLV